MIYTHTSSTKLTHFKFTEVLSQPHVCLKAVSQIGLKARLRKVRSNDQLEFQVARQVISA